MVIGLLAAAFAIIALVAHAAGFLVLARRCRAPQAAALRSSVEHVTVVRTVCDVGPFEARALRSTFGLSYPNLEILFCAGSAHDPAVPLVQQQIAGHANVPAQLLIGDDPISPNAKLNNMVKGWRAAQGRWVLFADSNLILPPDYVDCVLATWRPGTGAVCAPPVGSDAKGVCAELECAFLNGYQARWQYAADAIGFGFAQGKTMLLQRDMLEGAGGISALGRELAEDAALTKVVRAKGLAVRLAKPRFLQPIGHRTWRQMMDRQTRWAQLRRAAFPKFYALEIFSGMAAPLIAAMIAAAKTGLPPMEIGAVFVATWLGLELLFTWAVGWHLSWLSPVAWLSREALLPVVWVRGWLRRSYEWGGRTVLLGPPLASSGASARLGVQTRAGAPKNPIASSLGLSSQDQGTLTTKYSSPPSRSLASTDTA